MARSGSQGQGGAWAAIGGLLAAGSVALAAYASHGATGAAQDRLELAAALAFGHGLALAALAPGTRGGLRQLAVIGWAVGVALFSGSLVAAHFFSVSTRAAPVGGMLLIAAWLAYALSAWRR